ncbi:MAG: hypothetical protein HRU70_03135 [Phycisphaeraceae bacterium]|nr:MAG: hypothetical protein HRU70_03135 [Phycisphaeraceae bacterium]
MAMSTWLVRGVVIAGLVGGAAVLVAGPGRMRMLMNQTRDGINHAIDSNIQDPVLLRAQLRDLESKYAPRIAAVRSDLAQVREQVAQLKREQAVCARVVDLAQADLGTLRGMIARAESVRAVEGGVTTVSLGDAGFATPAVVRINFNSESLSVDQALNKAGRVEQVIGSYEQRSTEIDRDLAVLTQQESRLAELAERLEAERAEFQAQLWQLDHQIDTIARNDRMIELMEKRQRTIDDHSRYSAGSLDHVRGRISEIHARQEARLEGLGKAQAQTTYESKARIEVDASKRSKDRAAEGKTLRPRVIEIGPGDMIVPEATDEKTKSVASR